MGGGRVVHGTIAAAAAVLASAAATVDIPDKLHLKATPILFYAVPISMPLPPLSSLAAGVSGSVESSPFSVSLSRVFPTKDCASPPLSSAGSLSPPTAFAGSAREPSSASPPYASSDFSLAQGAPGVGSLLSVSSRRATGHLLPVCAATSVMSPQVSMSHSVLSPGMSAVNLPALAPFCFSTSGLYSAPVTEKFMTGAFRGLRKEGSFVGSSTLPYYSVFEGRVDSPPALAKLGGSAAQTHSSAYLESLLSTLLSFQSSVPDSSPTQPSESLHAWHVPAGRNVPVGRNGGDEDPLVKKPMLTVVLLGWLGAQQKHLKKYAEWYNARGIHAVTFVIPMTDILSFKGQGNAEEHVDALARHLVQWLSDQGEHVDLEGEKQLIFHTFSNTGWLTYGAILEKMQKQGGNLVERIKGCVVDSAPVPDPDPQVWASGFSAALLKKRSSATKPASLKGEVKEGVTVEASSLGSVANLEMGGANGLETAVLSVLEGFFSLFLKLPAINQRLSEVVTVLQKKQPPCPQLYIYSTADKVIPVKAVEAFIEEQRKTGRVVRACNLQSSPHVDHFRSHPKLYSEQLSNFLKEVLPSTHAQA
ncbi:hypothetical protein KC19_3G225800 [Ceratodon purpureus]|uniref:Transmembrane protein 53 n=1 Tax=Ceratodon purpureus TaxID=3225 RepID=A0A8T0INR8_CERPU|nr:hypothetical protein KC19_3G225800 [Ceratodon purpureus]